MKTSRSKDVFHAAAAAREICERFASRIKAAQTFADAMKVVHDGPASHAPGGQHYSNLAFFLIHSVIPRGAGPNEKSLFIELHERMNANGRLTQPS